MKSKIIFSILMVQVACLQAISQELPVKEMVLQIDTLQYSLSANSINYKGNNYLAFEYGKENEVCNVKIFKNPSSQIKDVVLLESGDYDIIDSMTNINNKFYEFKVQFKHLTTAGFLKFRLQIFSDSTHMVQEVNLFPYTKTFAKLDVKDNELSAGEEKVFELITNHPDNIIINPDWINMPDFSYRLILSNGQIFLHLFASTTGKRTFTLPLQVNKPFMFKNNFVYELSPQNFTFNINASGLIFINADKTEITLSDQLKNNGIEIQIENNRFLQLNKTYIIENQKNPGGKLIGTLFTRDRISGNKMICILRAYAFHRQSEGFLYLKDNDDAKFITNLNIIPQTSIEKIKIMRNGADWIEDATIYPGETFNIRMEGQSLGKAKFNFDALIELVADSVIKHETSVEFKLKVPLNIPKKNIIIYINNQNSGKSLIVKEFQNARPFDYINISYGNGLKKVNDIKGPELYDKTIRDVVISFLPDKIDADNKLFGKQYLTIDIKIMGKKGEVIDLATIEDFAVCPGENSPRFPYYGKSDCKNSDISINSKISNTTYELKDWSRIRLTFKNSKDKYTTDPQNKTVEIILQKRYQFDIDVSFPAGLLIKKMDKPGLGNFGGISMAVIAQYSFYDKDKINHVKPYKFGVGFLAINAFNYSKDVTDRDMGAVVVCTLNPLNPDRKLSFPIYLGGGYLLSEKTWFWLIGPGISIQF
jgi:hypothetical protein